MLLYKQQLKMKNEYTEEPEFWQTHRNIEIAKKYHKAESSVLRKRKGLVSKWGDKYKCTVLGWYKWENVDWSKTDDEILDGWKGKKKPKLITISRWRPTQGRPPRIKKMKSQLN